MNEVDLSKDPYSITSTFIKTLPIVIDLTTAPLEETDKLRYAFEIVEKALCYNKICSDNIVKEEYSKTGILIKSSIAKDRLDSTIEKVRSQPTIDELISYMNNLINKGKAVKR